MELIKFDMHVSKTLCTIVLFSSLIVGAFGQENYIRDGRDGIYQIFLGNAVFGNEQDVFAKAKKYGFLRPFSIAEEMKQTQGNESPIFLGPYLGRETAEYVLEKVRKLGYSQAYMEGDEVSLTTDEGSKLTHTVQIGAFGNLNASIFATYANEPARGIVLLYEDGLLKVLAGLYPASSESYLKEYATSYWKKTIQADAFVRPFRLAYGD